MRKALAFSALLLCLTHSVTAQNDTIHWNDGSKLTKVQVIGFNPREVKYKERGATLTETADRVARLDVAKVKDKYKRAFAASRNTRVGTFRGAADKLKDQPFLAQFGYWEAARLLLDNGEYGDGFLVLKELQENCPDSGFIPRIYSEKCDYYLNNDKKSDLKAVASKYSTAAQTEGYPEVYKLEARFFEALSKGMAGEMDAKKFVSEMEAIVREAGTKLPNMANRARLQVANSARVSGKVEDATAAYNKILSDPKSNGATRGAAWLGLGHSYVAAGNPAEKEPYREGMMAFLRVYLDDEAGSGMKAEALFYGSQAAQKWGGKGASRVARTLRGRLLNQFPDSSWAKK